jgi:ATP-dependent Clp protease ATP-binding subunit ClpA
METRVAHNNVQDPFEMYERFTTTARQVLQLANQEALRLNHEYIGTEHILLGLVREGRGVAVEVLKKLDIDLWKIYLEVKTVVQSGFHSVETGMRPQTPRAKKVIEYALEEAHGFNHNYVGTEHLLLGLLREQEGVAALVLTNLGVRLNPVRDAILKILTDPQFHKDDDPVAEKRLLILSDKRDHPLAQQLEQMLAEFNHQKEWCVAKQQFEEAARLRDEGVAFREIMDRIGEMLEKNPNLGNPEQGHAPNP